MKKVNTLWSLLVAALIMGGCGVSASNPSGNFKIATDVLPSAQVESPYTANLQASGGTAPYSWSVRKGNWPLGVVLNSATGTIAGAPGQKGRFSITLGATDSSVPPKTTTSTLTLTVNTTQVAVTTTSLPSGAENVAYSTTLAADNGSSPYSWSLSSGKLPNGVTLQSDGTLSGTPTQAGTFSFTAEVTDASNSTATASLSLTIAAPSSPVISSLSPSGGPTAGGATVTISGANFASGASVTFGGVAASSVSVSSSSQIQAVAPGHVAGTVGVIVTENGQNSGSANFTYNALTPAVSGVSPNSGPSAGGTTVTISGSNFLAGALVLFGTAPATNVAVVSGTQIQATAPANAAGPATVSVQDPGNLTGSLSGGFTYTAAQTSPTITSVSPTSGASGSQITIIGANFTASDVVSFGSASTTSNFISSTQMTAVVPTLSTGTYSVTVTDPDPASTTLNNAFTVTAAPATPSGNQGLLSGCSYIGSGGCSLPSGWTLVAQQDFECGSNSHASPANPACGTLPPSQGTAAAGCPTCPFSNFETTQAHGGTYAFGGLYNSDGNDNDWRIQQGTVGSFNTIYISYWEYTDPNAQFGNSDYYMFSVTSPNMCGAFPAGTAFNAQDFKVPGNMAPSTTTTMLAGGQGDPDTAGCQGVFQYNNGTAPISIMAGQWRQVEILYTPSTSYTGNQTQIQSAVCSAASVAGCGNGQQTMYINGQLLLNVPNANLNGATSMADSMIEIGGVLTDFCNSDTGVRANPFSACPAAAPSPFHRYFDDIIVIKE